MMTLARYIEGSAFCRWVSTSHSLFAYPGVLFLHVFGMTIIVAVSFAICLRTLGYLTQVPFSSLNKFFPLMWIAFWTNVATGSILLAINATATLKTRDFYLKMVCVVTVVVIMRTLETRLFRNDSGDTAPVASSDKVLAGLALVLWVTVVTAGRLLGYLVNPACGF
jgi:hypothetical protein